MLSLVNSHAAAALQFGIERNFANKSEQVIFYDMGFSSTQVSRKPCAVRNEAQWRQAPLAQAQSAGLGYEQITEVGLIYSFEAVFNRHLSPRRSLLNQQHQYVPN